MHILKIKSKHYDATYISSYFHYNLYIVINKIVKYVNYYSETSIMENNVL
jgi:hypothetical protein